MTPELVSKLPQVGTTVFTVMSELAARHGAVNLGQGFPDFDPSARLQSLVTEAMRAGHNQYAPLAGVRALRERIADKVARLYGHRYDVDREITVSAGATEALMSAVLAVVHPGDEVIVLEPAFDSYVPAIRLAGGQPVFVPLDASDYSVPWDRVRAAVTPRTRLIMLNSPHNPSGAAFKAADLDALESLVQDTRLLVLSDEVYEHLVYDGCAHQSVARRPALVERSLVVSSFGKTFHATGWKVGYCCAPPALTEEFRRVHQFVVFAVSTPMQYAMAEYLRDPSVYLDLAAFYQRKRDRFIAGLAGSGFRVLPCAGTFFLLADYSALSDRSEEGFAKWLTEAHGVASIPVSALYDRPVESRRIRFCFAKKDETLDVAIERLRGVRRATG
jgi:methionine aminotransferase